MTTIGKAKDVSKRLRESNRAPGQEGSETIDALIVELEKLEYKLQVAEECLHQVKTKFNETLNAEVASPQTQGEAMTFKMPEPVAFLVEGITENKVIAHILHFTTDEAKNTASVFVQHYPTVNTVPLYMGSSLIAAYNVGLEEAAHICDGLITVGATTFSGSTVHTEAIRALKEKTHERN